MATTNPNDIVADFYCGSGTTLTVSEKLGRKWIGCDSSKIAIQITKDRLLNIHNSKNLASEKGKYAKQVRPFEFEKRGI